MSVPNQKCLIITKPINASPPFLQISEDDWHEAYTNLTYCAFGVYLYLAQNANGYVFEYSPTAIEAVGLMTKSTATKVRKELEAKGYIQDGRFYVESPAKRTAKARIVQEINNTITGEKA